MPEIANIEYIPNSVTEPPAPTPNMQVLYVYIELMTKPAVQN